MNKIKFASQLIFGFALFLLLTHYHLAFQATTWECW